MKRQILATALAVAILAMLTACGTKGSADSVGTDQAAQQVEEKEQATTEAERETESAEQSASTYTWEGVTVTFPESWLGRVLVTGTDYGFDVYQIASYEQNEDLGLGFLCEVCKDDYWRNDGAGETLLAYTDAGDFYYFREPTDFPVDTDDQAVVEEYEELAADLDLVQAMVTFDDVTIHTDAAEYMIPLSDTISLTEDQLLNESVNWLWIARNEIYARHGRKFTNEYLDSYFSSRSWYKPSSETIDDSALSETEQANVRVLLAQEESLKAEYPYPTRYEDGETAVADLDGDGTTETVTYRLTQTGDWEYQSKIIVNGTAYDLSDWYYPETPLSVFYITDLSRFDDRLEIAILDDGPSGDPITWFFRYQDGKMTLVGNVDGFPFAEENNGRAGFDGENLVMGRVRADLIETSYLDGYWWYDMTADTITQQEGGLYEYQTFPPHTLYVDLPVYVTMDESAPTRTLDAQERVYFLQSDLTEWILVQGADGTRGYVHVKDQTITNIGLPEEEVFSSVGYFD